MDTEGQQVYRQQADQLMDRDGSTGNSLGIGPALSAEGGFRFFSNATPPPSSLETADTTEVDVGEGLGPTFMTDNGLDLSSNEFRPSRSHVWETTARRTTDATEADMRELMKLSLMAYRLTTTAGLPPTNNLVSMTGAALKILGRVKAPVKQQQQLRRPLVLHDPTPKPTTSLAMQAVSCCEQILDAFTHVCSLLYVELMPEAPQLADDGEDDGMSAARAVMMVELISHLFEKLSCRQREVLTTILVDDDVSSPPDPDVLASGNYPTDLPTPTQSPSDRPSGIVSVVLQRAHGRHPQLEGYIRAIRDLTRRKSGA